MKKKTILVTGGAGMIGSNLVKNLVHLGHEVHVFDNLWRGCLQNLTSENGKACINLKQKFKKLDLSSYRLEKIKSPRFDVVIHLADVVAGIRYVFQNEHDIFNQNIKINSNVFSWVKRIKPKLLIYVGTACSFPRNLQNQTIARKLKETELYPADPESAYGWSKLMGTYECELLQKSSSIKVSNLIFHNVYGSPCDLGPRSQFIPATAMKIAQYPKQKLVVWGSGDQQRAFLHVHDAVRALTLSLDKGHNQGPIQVGPSRAYSIKEVVEKLIQISGKKIEPIYDRNMPEGDKSRAADLSKAKKLLGWSPLVKIEDGLRELYQWVSEKSK